MREISETEIKSMTKEQNYIRGYKDGKSDACATIRAKISRYSYGGFELGDGFMDGYYKAMVKILDIIDEYKAEVRK